MFSKIDLTGRQFGRLTALQECGRRKHHGPMWLCRCTCGTEKIVPGVRLRTGVTRSCGCLLRDSRTIPRFIKHGKYGSRVRSIWNGMIQRCSNPRRKGWENYGGRGITVCERWKSFPNFYADMGDPPDGTSLDRVDSDGNYEPGNCRWATRTEQGANRRGNLLVTFEGKAQVLSAWATELRMSRWTLYNRYRRGVRPPELFR